MKPPYVPPLTSLRFFAAALIAISHPLGLFGWEAWDQAYYMTVGVPFFFTLSGFVLYLNYGGAAPRIRAVDFIALRFARIWPLHVVTLVVCAPLYVNIFPDFTRLTQLPANLFLVQSWLPIPGVNFSFNGVSWTLSVEWFFYCLFPFLAPHLLISALIAGPVMLAIWVFVFNALPSLPPPAMEFSSWSIFWTSPLVFTQNFVVGMIACRAFLRIRETQFARNSLAVSLLQIVGLGGLIFLVAWGHPLRSVFVDSLRLGGLYGAWAFQSATAIICAFGLMTISLPNTRIFRAVSARPLVWLGE